MKERSVSVRAHLARMERSLSPQQAVIRWHQPLLEARTPREFAQRFWEASQQDGIDEQLRRIRSATRAALRGSDRRSVEAVEREAASEYYFLFQLVGRVNQWVADKWEAHTLRSVLVVTQAGHLPLLFLHAHRAIDDREREAHLRWSERDYEQARQLLVRSTAEFEGHIRAGATISRTYLAGAPSSLPAQSISCTLAESAYPTCGTHVEPTIPQTRSTIRVIVRSRSHTIYWSVSGSRWLGSTCYRCEGSIGRPNETWTATCTRYGVQTQTVIAQCPAWPESRRPELARRRNHRAP